MIQTTQEPVQENGVSISGILITCWLLGIVVTLVGNYIEDPLQHISTSPWVPVALYAVGVTLLMLGGVYFTLRTAFLGFGSAVRNLLGSGSGCGMTLGLIILAFGMALVVLPIPLAFAYLTHDLYTMFGGFTGAPHGLTHLASIDAWSRFAYSWMWDSVSINFSQIFNLAPTPISPTADWSKWMLFIYCVVMDFIVAGGLFNLARRTFSIF